MDKSQQCIDAFYVKNGPCCSGCDWWESIGTVLAGECKRSAPVSGEERVSMLGFEYPSRVLHSGHIITPRDHVCGDFKDDFDWYSLPPSYLRSIGMKPRET